MRLFLKIFVLVLTLIGFHTACGIAPLRAETGTSAEVPSMGAETGTASQSKKRTVKKEAAKITPGQEVTTEPQPGTTSVKKKRTSKKKSDSPASGEELGIGNEMGNASEGKKSESKSKSEPASRSKKSVPAGEKVYKLKNIQVFVKAYKDKDRSSVRLTCSGRTRYSCESRTIVPEAMTETDAPRKGYESMLFEVYSGGGHCCYTTVVCVVHDSQATATAFDRQDGGTFGFTDANGDGVKEIQINDWSFAYYCTNDSDLELSFAASPAMARLMVYEGEKWRADRPGEFKSFYLERKARCEKDAKSEADKAKQQGYFQRTRGEIENSVAKVIETAYYMHMSGGAEDEIRGILQNLLPPAWQSQSKKIASDIRRFSKDFNPTRRIF